MKSQILLFIANYITGGARPVRIFIFGGLLFSVAIMVMLTKLMGMDSNFEKDLNLTNSVLLIFSILTGYGISYSIVHIADAIKQRSK